MLLTPTYTSTTRYTHSRLCTAPSSFAPPQHESIIVKVYHSSVVVETNTQLGPETCVPVVDREYQIFHIRVSHQGNSSPALNPSRWPNNQAATKATNSSVID
jgi:hypothetical protein